MLVALASPWPKLPGGKLYSILESPQYMKLLDIPVGLLINFHEMKVIEGVHRLILSGANRPAEERKN